MGFKNGNPGCPCCTPASPCGCGIPKVLTFVNSLGASSCPDSLDWPFTLTYGACPTSSPIAVYPNSGGVSLSCQSLTMPANSWWSPQITITQGGFPCPYPVGSPVTYRWIWAYVAGCVLYVRHVFYRTSTDGTCPGGVDSHYYTENKYMLHSAFNCSPFSANSFVDYQNNPSIWSHLSISGTHGSDDIATDAGGNAGNP